ncbi:MAG: peptide chain release factor 2, partial [Pseudomonadota bacterium]
MRAEAQNHVDAIEKSLLLLKQRMDWETAAHRLEEFDALIEDPKLWDDQVKAQRLMRDRQALIGQIETVQGVMRDLGDNVALIELGEMEGDQDVVAEAEAALAV